MSDGTRDLRHGEKRLAIFSSEKGRDRANAQRTIEGLNQNDQIIDLLTRLVAQAEYQSARLAAIEVKLSQRPN